MPSIIIDQKYLDNISLVVDSINNFFISEYKTNDFPTDDMLLTVPSFFKKVIDIFRCIEPSWINNVDQIDSSVKFVIDYINNEKNDNTTSVEDFILNKASSKEPQRIIKALCAIRTLQFIGDNYADFVSLVQGMYSFELFTTPSKYKNAINTFASTIRMEMLDTVMKTEYNVFETEFFDIKEYARDVYENNLITLPENFDSDNDINRISNYTDLLNIDIRIASTVQEAYGINYFKKTVNPHFKYDEYSKKFKLSKQYKSAVDKFVEKLNKCDTTDDLDKMFTDKSNADTNDVSIFLSNVIPFIMIKVYNNKTKYPFDNINMKNMDNYIKSYNSISDVNLGARRFIKYDLYSVFKTDKEGTIKFIKDFLTLDLFNDTTAFISNNVLLTIFNIFDSRIYLDILYNNIPAIGKVDDYYSENEFVKNVRGRINANSRKANVYSNAKNSADKNQTADTTDTVVEYVNMAANEYGDMSVKDMSYCEHYSDILYKECTIMDDLIYRKNLSPILINEYMSSCENSLNSIYQESETGDIPSYMKNRIDLSDGEVKPTLTELDVDLPKSAPLNPLEDVLGSIDAKMDDPGELDTLMGTGYKSTHKNDQSGIVYNITNNYSNSFNKTSTDSSTGKTINNINSNNTGRETDNNYNNSIKLTDSKVSNNVIQDGKQKLSSGHTIQEVFAFLEAEEPLSETLNAGDKPKSDLLTTAMDVDRKTLGKQQSAKKAVQKVVNTGKAITKPVTRTKQWMTKVIDSLIKRDEDKVKAEIIENPSYRTALYKASRIALKLGLTSICFTISGYLSAAYVTIQGAKVLDKQRLRKEVQSEFGTELEILNDKIERASQSNDPKDRQAMYQMMRLRNKMKDIAVVTPKQTIKHPRSVW